MNERIHRVLDGELRRDELTPAEAALLAEYEATIGAVDASLDRFDAPDLTSSVMARITALEAPAAAPGSTASAAAAPRVAAPAASGTPRTNPFAQAIRWLVTPRPIALRPAWALGAAALAAVALMTGLPVGDDANRASAPVASAVESTPASAEIYVHFRLDAPDASSVHLAGDFTGWEPSYELHQSQPGVWTVVVPLQAGVHDYAFVIDGERWTPDPLATTVDDGFGGQNSRLSLLPPERIRA